MHVVDLIDLSSRRLAPWRFLRSLVAVLMSLLLLASAAIEAGRRLLPTEQVLGERLVQAWPLTPGSA